MGISSISNAIDAWKDKDTSWVQKLTSTTMALTMGLAGLMAIIQGVGVVTDVLRAKKMGLLATTNQEAIAEAKVAATKLTAATAEETMNGIIATSTLL
jgi:hypothetical protein